jgi:release factor glutamine methyltransferase
VQALAAAGITDAAGDARHLVAHALGIKRDRLLLLGPDLIPAEVEAPLAAMLARRIAHEPVTRIIGQRLFWGRAFTVTPDVLDPRPDTETLIEAALNQPQPRRLLDLGTGSGAIAVTLLAEWPNSTGVATDISAPALAVAGRNAQAHGVDDRLEMILSDWCDAVAGHFDLILSNPPYIAAHELPDLSPEVRLHDPAIALSPGVDGLAPYRIIAEQAPAYLAPHGRVMVEIGWQQGGDVMAIFQAAGWKDTCLIHDIEGRDRVVIAQDFADPAEITRKFG